MTLLSSAKTLFIMSMGTCLFFLGCGKKPQTDSEHREVVRSPQTQVDTNLEKQSVACEGTQACPSYISKVVIVYGKEYKYCTGFLTEDNMVVTSSSCLPHLLRLNGQDCSKDIFFFFPKTSNRPAEKVGCSKVNLVSQLEGEDPVLWRDDVAFLEMDKALPQRRRAKITREGIQNGRRYTSWMIDQQDEFSAIIKKTECEAVHKNFVNPLVQSESSPNMMFAGCSLTNGGTGAPILDNSGKVRSVISKEMNPKVQSDLQATGLLSQSLESMIHATNFACAPTHLDHNMLDEKECLKDLTYVEVGRYRQNMLTSNTSIEDLRKKLETDLLTVSRYIKLGVNLILKGQTQEVQVYPKCFKPLQDWLSTLGRGNHDEVLQLSSVSLKKAIDTYGRIVGQMVEGTKVPTVFQFSANNLRNYKKSFVWMWPRFDVNSTRTFENVAECSQLLP